MKRKNLINKIKNHYNKKKETIIENLFFIKNKNKKFEY